MPGDPEFRMAIEDIFFIRGRGTIVTGVISQGTLSVGDFLTLNGCEGENQIEVAGIEIFRRRTHTAHAGERVGVVLRGISKDEVSRGDMLACSYSY